MGTVIPPGFAEVSLEFNHPDWQDSAFIVYGVDISASGGDFEQVAATELDLWELDLKPIQDSTSTMDEVVVRIGSDPPPGPIVVLANPTPIGGASRNALPPQNAVLVRKNTLVGGREHKGRIYLPSCFSSEEDVDEGGRMTVAFQGIIQTRMTAWHADHISGGGNPFPQPLVLLHNNERRVITVTTEPRDAAAPTELSSLSTVRTIKTQRRRANEE